MFAPSLGRAVRSVACASQMPAASLRCAALSTTHQPMRINHQRRLSSSKPSVPPKNKKKPIQKTDEDLATRAEVQGAGNEQRAEVAQDQVSAHENDIDPALLVQHLSPEYITTASFFARHRPLPIRPTQPITMDDFGKILDGRSQEVEEAAQARIRRTAQAYFMEHVWQAREEANHGGVVDEAFEALFPDHAEVKQTPHEAIVRQAATLPPWSPPPPPVPFDPFAGQQEDLFESFNTVTSSFHDMTQSPTSRRDHVARRRGGMFLISVKRQRKLKMKKHKYKKLMKRTRLLRRKLDRT